MVGLLDRVEIQPTSQEVDGPRNGHHSPSVDPLITLAEQQLPTSNQALTAQITEEQPQKGPLAVTGGFLYQVNNYWTKQPIGEILVTPIVEMTISPPQPTPEGEKWTIGCRGYRAHVLKKTNGAEEYWITPPPKGESIQQTFPYPPLVNFLKTGVIMEPATGQAGEPLVHISPLRYNSSVNGTSRGDPSNSYFG